MALQEDERTNKWKKQDICIGSTKACAFPGLISSYNKFIISFAEDEAGELYFMATSYPSAYAPHGALYKFVDPARRAPPGKCKQKPSPVKTKSKRIPFTPYAKTVLELLNEQLTTRSPKREANSTKLPSISSGSKSRKKASHKKQKPSKPSKIGRRRLRTQPHRAQALKLGRRSRKGRIPHTLKAETSSPKMKGSQLARAEKKSPQSLKLRSTAKVKTQTKKKKKRRAN